jgi:hypothetical protein
MRPPTGIYTEEDIQSMDYAERNAQTVSQKRIEDYMERRENVRDLRILHVGIGNSSVAIRFRAARRIDGLTVVNSEYRKGCSLNLNNYRVLQLDKHGLELAKLEGEYDIIIDNNLNSYAPDFRALLDLLDCYHRLLASDGKVILERGGLLYIYKESRCPRILVSWLKLLAGGFIVEVHDRDVIVMRLREGTADNTSNMSFPAKLLVWILSWKGTSCILNSRYARLFLAPQVYLRRILWHHRFVRIAKSHGLTARKITAPDEKRRYVQLSSPADQTCLAQIHKDRARTNGSALVIGSPGEDFPQPVELEEITEREWHRLDGDFGKNRHWLRGRGKGREEAKVFFIPLDVLDEPVDSSMRKELDALFLYVAKRD